MGQEVPNHCALILSLTIEQVTCLTEDLIVLRLRCLQLFNTSGVLQETVLKVLRWLVVHGR